MPLSALVLAFIIKLRGGLALTGALGSQSEEFPLFQPHKLARRDDLGTSKAAAREAESVRANHFRVILEALESAAPGDLTAEEIADSCDLDRVQICKRFAEMRRAGLIELSGQVRRNRNGRRATCYRLPGGEA